MRAPRSGSSFAHCCRRRLAARPRQGKARRHAGLGGADIGDAETRFKDVDTALRGELGVGISVGLATLLVGETADQLTARADEALIEVKAARTR